MFKKIKLRHVLVAIILVGLGLSLFNLLPSDYNLMGGHFVNNGPVTMIADTIVPASADLSDSLMTYSQFAAIEQEAKYRKSREELSDKGIGNNFETFFLGVSVISECDTCSLSNQRFLEFGIPRYYLSLPGYSLQPREAFEYRQGKAVLNTR